MPCLLIPTAVPEQIPEIIATYCLWYAEMGMTMGKVYPGIFDLLDALLDAGIPLGVATQKTQAVARTVLRKHGIDVYFDVIAGVPDEETPTLGGPACASGKEDIIAEALDAFSPTTAVMIGDRAQDVEGAHANNIACVGAGWGWGAPGNSKKQARSCAFPSTRHNSLQLLLDVSGRQSGLRLG